MLTGTVEMCPFALISIYIYATTGVNIYVIYRMLCYVLDSLIRIFLSYFVIIEL